MTGVPPLARSVLLERLRRTPRWDVVVIGGGASGLGCAVDAAARGHSTLLVEAHDFAKGTSSRSTKLIHGGVRYLAQGRLGLVRESLAERALLLANAPHLVRPLRFVVPAYRWHERPMLGVGLSLYDLLAGHRGLGPCRLLSPAETRIALPNVNPPGLRGGIAYWDAQFDDAGLAIALMRTVFDQGGLALNYLPVTGLLHEGGRIAGVELRDAESGESFEARASVVINATGVWSDSVRRMDEPAAAPMLAPSQGVHLVVERDFLPGDDALLVPSTDDGRVLFVIPWQGKVLLGTTDTPRSDCPLEPQPLAGEVDFILRTAGRYLARPPSRDDVKSVFAGLRPLIGAGGGPTSVLSREHVIAVSPSGLVTVAGGKWTTYRHMAEQVVDRAEVVGGLQRRACITRSLKLHGAGSPRAAGHGLLPDVDAIRHAVDQQLARTVEDVLARRSRTLFLDVAAARAAAPGVVAAMADRLGRNRAWRNAQLAGFDGLASGFCIRP